MQCVPASCRVYPPAALSPHKKCPATIPCARGACCPIRGACGLLLPVACARGAPPSESPRCRGLVCRGIPMAVLPSSSGAVCLRQGWPSSRVPSAVVFHSPPVAQLPVALWAVPTPPPPVVSPGLTSGACVSAPSPHPSFSGCGVPGGGADAPCGAHSAWLISVQLLRVSQRH